jgi:hypothetical protein
MNNKVSISSDGVEYHKYRLWAIGYRKARKNKQRMKRHLKQWEKKNE